MNGASLDSLRPALLSADAGAMRIRRLLAKLIAEERATGQPSRSEDTRQNQIP